MSNVKQHILGIKKQQHHNSVGTAIAAAYVPLRNKQGNTTTTWCTPTYIVKAVSPIDLDPATPQEGMRDEEGNPWRTATRMLTPRDDGLLTPWPKAAFVWLNPPYGKGMNEWMKKAAEHGNGISLIFLRADTKYFHESVFTHPNTTGLFVFEGRLKFRKSDGSVGKSGPASPSVLVAYGQEAWNRILIASQAGLIRGHALALSANSGSCMNI